MRDKKNGAALQLQRLATPKQLSGNMAYTHSWRTKQKLIRGHAANGKPGKRKTRHKLKVLRSGDPNTAFPHLTPSQILDSYGLPSYLLGSSAKLEKCDAVGVLARVLYLTPGIFCSAASRGCLQACLGHNSGRMAMPDSYTARDKRTAWYLEDTETFLRRLKYELHLLTADALWLRLLPAARQAHGDDAAA